MGETKLYCTSKDVNVANLNYVLGWKNELTDDTRKISDEIESLNKILNPQQKSATKCIICEIYANVYFDRSVEDESIKSTVSDSFSKYVEARSEGYSVSGVRWLKKHGLMPHC